MSDIKRIFGLALDLEICSQLQLNIDKNSVFYMTDNVFISETDLVYSEKLPNIRYVRVLNHETEERICALVVIA